MKIKIKKPDIPVAIFKVDREKLILPSIPEMEGTNNYGHNVIALILANVDLTGESIYDTRQFAEEIVMSELSYIGEDRYYAEFYVAQLSFEASRKGLFDYEYLGDNKYDYGRYVRYSKSPIKNKGRN